MKYEKIKSCILNSNTKNQISKSPQEVESLLIYEFNNFQPDKIHKAFLSYDFKKEEKDIVDIWNYILNFLYEKIFNTFAVNFYDLKKYTIIKDHIPIGLNNIIQQLRAEQKYIFETDIKDDNFYRFTFPELYKSNGLISTIFYGIKNLFNLAGGTLNCLEDSGREEIIVRKDITTEEKYKKINEDILIINYDMFINHCNELNSLIYDYVFKHKEEVLTMEKLEIIIKFNSYPYKNKNESNNLIYGTQHLSYALEFLMKIKKIIIFEVMTNDKLYQCIKVLQNQNDRVEDKDLFFAKINLTIEIFERKKEEMKEKIKNLELIIQDNLTFTKLAKVESFLVQKLIIEKNNLPNVRHIIKELKKQVDDFKTVSKCKQINENIGLFFDFKKQIQYSNSCNDLKAKNGKIYIVNQEKVNLAEAKTIYAKDFNYEMKKLWKEKNHKKAYLLKNRKTFIWESINGKEKNNMGICQEHYYLKDSNIDFI